MLQEMETCSMTGNHSLSVEQSLLADVEEDGEQLRQGTSRYVHVLQWHQQTRVYGAKVLLSYLCILTACSIPRVCSKLR